MAGSGAAKGRVAGIVVMVGGGGRGVVWGKSRCRVREREKRVVGFFFTFVLFFFAFFAPE